MFMKTTRKRPKGSFLLAWIRGSVILQMLDRLSDRIYRAFGTGFFGWLFTRYPSQNNSLFASFLFENPVWKCLGKIRRFCNRQVEGSIILLLIQSAVRRFLRCRMRNFGIFLVSFGAYTAVFHMVSELLQGERIFVTDHPQLLFSILVICSAVPLMFSRSTLRETLCSSYTGSILLRVLGYTPEEVMVAGAGKPVSRMNVAFLCGVVCGVMTYRVDPWWILGGILALLFAYLVLGKPEIGVLTLFFVMPFLPTMVLAALVIYIFFCFALKVLRGKRIIHLEPLDIMVMAFAVILCFGGIVSLSAGSLKPALLFVCFLAGYFEVTWLLRDRKWLNRCAAAAVLSASLVSLYGIFQYFTGTAVMASAWVDSEMFSSIGGRAVGTLENPNMMGEYLILLLPLAAVMLVGFGEGLRRLPAFVCMGIMGCCLILTWSRGAWLGMLFAVVLFVFLWHRRAVWLLFAGVAMIPVLPYVLPDTIIQRFTSIGNLGDSSTSYRMHIWRASCNMLRDFGMTGIGIGENAWFQVYPEYAFMGVETAPHSHNLFLQIWLEMGICGLIVFLLILFLLCQSVFAMYRQLQQANHIELPELHYGDGDLLSGTAHNRMIKKTKTQLRLACAAPLSGIFAVLVQGMTDYAWYNYRVYLMFWLILGLASGYVRSAKTMILESDMPEEDCAAVDLLYRSSRGGQNRLAAAKKKTCKENFDKQSEIEMKDM